VNEKAQTANIGLLQTGLTNKFESLYLRFGFCAVGQLSARKSPPDSKPQTVTTAISTE